MMNNNELVTALNSKMNIDFENDLSSEQLLDRLTSLINHLINTDFNRLIAILYRVDINENKLKKLLEDDGQDSALIIAKLILEREIQKIKTRKKFK